MFSCLQQTGLIRLGLLRLLASLRVTLRSSRSLLLLLHAKSGGEQLL